jgi:hypothetical protein
MYFTNLQKLEGIYAEDNYDKTRYQQVNVTMGVSIGLVLSHDVLMRQKALLK